MRFSRKILYHWGGFINQMLRLYTYIKRNVYYAVFRGFKATTWYLFLKGTNLLKYIKVTYSQMFNRVQVWNRRFLPLGICFIIFRFIVATQVCYCMLLHATACYCMLLHATAIYPSWCNCWCMWSCEDFRTESTLGNVSCGFILQSFCVGVCPGHCWSRNAWNFGTPAMRWQLESNSQVTFCQNGLQLEHHPLCSKVDKTCRWNWMDSPFEQMLYFDSGCL